MGDKAYHSNLRVEGFVKPGSIEHNGPHVTFVMNEFESHSPKAPGGRLLTVIYKGSEPPPDTFKDDSQALAEEPMAATANSTPPSCKPSAPASTPRPRPTASPALNLIATPPANAAPNNSPRAAAAPQTKPAS